MNTDAIITIEDITAACARLHTDTVAKLVSTMSDTEPQLFGFVMSSVHAMAGRLALHRVDNEIIQDTADEMLELTLTCLIAHRHSFERLWSDAGPEAADGAEST